MDKSKLVINTLVFIEDLKNGVPQSLIMDKLKELEIKNVEIRREFIKDFNKEVLEIKEKSKVHDMRLFYSVPEWIYEEGNLRATDIESYFKEAYEMNCNNIKMNIGEIKEVSKEDIEKINGLCEKYDIRLTVENDQTAENGRSEKIYDFLTKVKNLGGNISFTFDVGNWIFQEEDPVKNAELLSSFVIYVHLKNIGKKRNNVLIDQGVLDIKKIVDLLPKNLPMALEYPCETKEQLALEITKILNLV